MLNYGNEEPNPNSRICKDDNLLFCRQFTIGLQEILGGD
jgi:hypothetical protein